MEMIVQERVKVVVNRQTAAAAEPSTPNIKDMSRVIKRVVEELLFNRSLKLVSHASNIHLQWNIVHLY